MREWRRKQDAVHQARDLVMHVESMPVAELGCMICDLSNRVQSRIEGHEERASE